MNDLFRLKVSAYLSTLCSVKPNRRTGSPGNQAAVEYFAGTIQQFGFEVDTTPFDCLDYVSGASRLEHDGQSFDIQSSPYSSGCDISAELVKVTSLEDLEQVAYKGKILLMEGEICSEPLMPKNFPFYNPDHHQRIYGLLEAKQPAGIVTATGRNPELVGAIYPFPLIADGDFDIPNAYCTEPVGAKIALQAGRPVRLIIDSRRVPSSASNAIGRRNPQAAQKIVVTAHIDAYEDTPGATDNATGTAVLLLLAEMLADYPGGIGIEIAAFNGEDHYSAGGQKDYLNRYGSGLNGVSLAINIDGIGYKDGKSAFSFYECPPALQQLAENSFQDFPGLVMGEAWYSGDHMIFLQAGLPCLALTSEKALELLRSITHARQDTPEMVDPGKVVEAAFALNRLIRSIGG